MRLHRFLAEAGVSSRRGGERLILEGRVAVNGCTVRSVGTQVDPERDRITFEGRPLRLRRKRYVALHKPRGCLCTRCDPQSRQTVVDLLPAEWRDLYPVGRLDCESEGLLFLTNDGAFCLRMTHPRYGVRKIYSATVEGCLAPDLARRLTRGVKDRGELLRADRARVVRSGAARSVIELELTEGKNREVRRLLVAQGLKVVRLVRMQIGTINLGGLPAAKWRTLTPGEVDRLMAGAGRQNH